MIKTKKWTPSVKRISISLLAVSLIFALSSCATRTAFLSSQVVPAAKGHVKVRKDHNNNYLIKLKIANLAGSLQLSPPKKAYIVWLVADNQSIYNIGQIQSSSSLLSKKLKASFETVSSFKPVRIFITAEDDESIKIPYSKVVLTTADI